jgi:hypothetical protein
VCFRVKRDVNIKGKRPNIKKKRPTAAETALWVHCLLLKTLDEAPRVLFWAQVRAGDFQIDDDAAGSDALDVEGRWRDAEVCSSVKRDLQVELLRSIRAFLTLARDTGILPNIAAKETEYPWKMHKYSKRSIIQAKETEHRWKRDLLSLTNLSAVLTSCLMHS